MKRTEILGILNHSLIIVVMILVVIMLVPNTVNALESNTGYLIISDNLFLKFFINDESELKITSGYTSINGVWEKIDSIKILSTSDNFNKVWMVGVSEKSKHELYFQFNIDSESNKLGLWAYDGKKITEFRNTFNFIKIDLL